MLAPGALLDLWEYDAPAMERALRALAAWNGDHDAAALPLDELNRRLLAMRADVFGDALEFYAECGHCGAAIEFAVPVAYLMEPPERVLGRLRLGDMIIECRPPTTSDVAATIGAADPRRALLERCVVSVVSSSTVEPVAGLSDDALASVEAFLETQYPLLDITLRIECPACGHAWSDMLDVTGHLWADIDTEARRLLEEVAVLASAYGWSEHDVLAMSARRRTHYLELIA